MCSSDKRQKCASIRSPKTVFEGTVEQINQQAEFLPRNVQTREERVHQVFGVKIRIDDPSNRVRAGMAADVKLKAAKGI